MSAKELMLSNSGAGEDSWESLGQQEIRPANPKENQPQIFIGRTDAEAEYFPILSNILFYPMQILIEIGTSLL